MDVTWNTKPGPSAIHGTGVFAVQTIERGGRIMTERAKHKGYNHSCTPNALLLRAGKQLYTLAKARIAAGEEITVDYYAQTGGKPTTLRCNCPGCRLLPRPVVYAEW
jgi:L-asparaginase II